MSIGAIRKNEWEPFSIPCVLLGRTYNRGEGELRVDDREIIQRVKEGNVEEFSLLVEKYHRQLLRFLHRIVRDGALAEDIGQEVFFQLYKKLHKYDEHRGTPFSAWLFITARNAAISELRKRKKEVPLLMSEHVEESTSSLQQQVEAREETAQFLKALDCVDEPFRTTLVHSLQGKSIKEIAHIEEISAGTVKSRIYRAKKILFSLLSHVIERGCHGKI